MNEVAHVVALLEARGVHAEVVADDFAHRSSEVDRDHDAGPKVVTASLKYRNRDAVAVREVLCTRGVLMPRLR